MPLSYKLLDFKTVERENSCFLALSDESDFETFWQFVVIVNMS